MFNYRSIHRQCFIFSFVTNTAECVCVTEIIKHNCLLGSIRHNVYQDRVSEWVNHHGILKMAQLMRWLCIVYNVIRWSLSELKHDA